MREPDDDDPNNPTPDGIISDGEHEAAVEIKRLTGDETWNDYVRAVRSLDRSLAPSSGGRYHLAPPLGFPFPYPPALIRKLRQEIERVAPNIPLGEQLTLQVPRRGVLKRLPRSFRNFIYCDHGDLPVYDRASAMVPGAFYLADGRVEHSLIDPATERRFEERLVERLTGLEEGQIESIDWDEDWTLWKTAEAPRSESRVTVIAVHMGDPGIATRSAALACLAKAHAKFRDHRWANLQIAVLEEAGIFMDAEHLTDAFGVIDMDHFPGIDWVVYLTREDATRVWARDPREISPV